MVAGRSGAADNYLFPTLGVGILLIAIGASHVHVSVRHLSLLILTLITIAQSWVLLTGSRGEIKLSKDTINIAPILSSALAETPGPKMVWHQTLGLPWNTPNVDTRILDPSIDVAGASRIPGAVNAMSRLASGYYATVAIPTEMRGLIDQSKYQVKLKSGRS